MSENPGLASLPTELLLHIAGLLSNRDLSSFCRLGRRFHWCLFYPLFDSTVTEGPDFKKLKKSLISLFFHAVKHDSSNIMHYLIHASGKINLNEPIPMHDFLTPSNFTFLHLALLADAPRVAVCLLKNGADIDQELDEYPDLTPLYLTLPSSLISSTKSLDSALRIACSYALARTTRYLLVKGASASTIGTYGTSAIHAAVMRRRPWRDFPVVNYMVWLQFSDFASRWESQLTETVSTLLDFGVDVHIQTQISRTHECEPKCWRSIDCENKGQTALHIASAGGILAIVTRLLDAGADPNLLDERGYTALYPAFVQGHEDVASHLLERCYDLINPIVCIPELTTALHIVCRFNFVQMVAMLLEEGADPNTTDCYGRTPLHDVLDWARLNREEEVLSTLGYLISYGADLDIATYNPTPRQLADTHVLIRVREMFLTRQEKARSGRARHRFSTHDDGTSENRDKEGSRGLAQSGLWDSAEREAEVSQLPQDPFPKLDHLRNDRFGAISPEPEKRIGPELEKSVWAPSKTSQLIKGMKPNKLKSKQDDAKVVVPTPFPELVAKARHNSTPTTALVASVWSNKETSQLVKNLPVQMPPSKYKRRPQKRTKERPELSKPLRFNNKSVVSNALNTEATQFWGQSKTKTAGESEQAVLYKNNNSEESRAGMAGTKTPRNRNKKGWTALKI